MKSWRLDLGGGLRSYEFGFRFGRELEFPWLEERGREREDGGDDEKMRASLLLISFMELME